MTFELQPKNILKLLLSLILFLLLANIIGITSRIYFNHGSVYGLVPLFDFNTEKNIPTLFSSINLLITSVLLSIIASHHRKLEKNYIQWAILSAIFFFLAIDETNSIHEKLGLPTRKLLGTSGVLYYAWVIPYFVALIAFVIAYFKFLLHLPKNIMFLFLISGFTFVSGAIGFEMLGGWQAELHGNKGILYSFFYTCEELLEMAGIAIFIYTLFTYMVNEFGFMKINIKKSTAKNCASSQC
jgi:hypothetical protein